MWRRKIMGCGESWKKLTILACQGFIFDIWISTALYTKKVDFRLILTILIFLFAVPKLATQILHSLKYLTHLIFAIHV